MVRQMYANTPAANLEAVLQHRHQPHHGKTVADAGGKLEAIDHVEEAALSSNSSAPHLVEATFDGRSSRAVCLHAAAHWPMPKKIAGGLHCEHTQAWHACNKGFFRMYLPPAAIAHFHKRATAGIERSKTVFAIVAGPSAELLYTNNWCACRECRNHPLLMSPRCLRRDCVGNVRTITYVVCRSA